MCFSLIIVILAHQQALQGALAAGREKEGELATTRLWNRPFPCSPGPLYQNEVKCSAFDMKLIFHSHANKTHFHKKDCALGSFWKRGFLELGNGLLEKVHAKFLIDGDNILSKDVITPNISMFVYIRAPFRFPLIGGNLTVQSTGSHRVTGGGTQIPET